MDNTVITFYEEITWSQWLYFTCDILYKLISPYYYLGNGAAPPGLPTLQSSYQPQPQSYQQQQPQYQEQQRYQPQPIMNYGGNVNADPNERLAASFDSVPPFPFFALFLVSIRKANETSHHISTNKMAN